MEALLYNNTDRVHRLAYDLDDYELAGIAAGKKVKFISSGFTPDFVSFGTGENEWTGSAAWQLHKFTDKKLDQV